MKRRTLLTGVGSLAATSAVAVGTGAFSSVSADRSVSVEVADDSSALLMFDPGLKSSTNDVFASYEDGQLSSTSTRPTPAGKVSTTTPFPSSTRCSNW